ncbi:MAG: carbohydrate-binding family 9-like protein [Bacteroidota bacterium]
MQLEFPAIHLHSSEWAKLEPSIFNRSTDGSPSDFLTHVKLMADDQYLHVKFECERDLFVAENYLTQHNDPLYNQEVFEIFIAAGESAPAHYLEFEINPNNAIWVGKISNPSLGEGSISAEMVGHDESGILHSVKKGKDCWSGQFSIPWVLISGQQRKHYRVNFYRIVSTKSQAEKDWVCGEDCEFLCWNSTLSGAVAAFHKPRRFGHLVIH